MTAWALAWPRAMFSPPRSVMPASSARSQGVSPSGSVWSKKPRRAMSSLNSLCQPGQCLVRRHRGAAGLGALLVDQGQDLRLGGRPGVGRLRRGRAAYGRRRGRPLGGLGGPRANRSSPVGDLAGRCGEGDVEGVVGEEEGRSVPGAAERALPRLACSVARSVGVADGRPAAAVASGSVPARTRSPWSPLVPPSNWPCRGSVRRRPPRPPSPSRRTRRAVRCVRAPFRGRAARCPRRRAAADASGRSAVGASTAPAPGASGIGGAERRWRPIRCLPSPGASTGSTGAATAAELPRRQDGSPI